MLSAHITNAENLGFSRNEKYDVVTIKNFGYIFTFITNGALLYRDYLGIYFKMIKII